MEQEAPQSTVVERTVGNKPPASVQPQRVRPTVQTINPVSYLQSITPPPSTSPVSATVIGAVNDMALRTAHASATMPSPIASPQLPELTTFDVPKYLSDGSCQMHTVNLRNATIEDHNLILGDIQRLGQQIKDSVVPNSSLLLRYSRLKRALDMIRRQISVTKVQSTQELVSDVLRRATPTRQTQSHLPSVTMRSQSPNTPASSVPHSPVQHQVPFPQNERLQPQFQVQNATVPTMLPPPQPLNIQSQALPSMGYFRPPAVHATPTQHPQSPLTLNALSAPNAPFLQPQIWTRNVHASTNYVSSSTHLPQVQSARHQLPQIISQDTQHQHQQLNTVPSPGGAGSTKQVWCRPFLNKLHFLMAQPDTEPWKPNDSLRASLLESALKQEDDLRALDIFAIVPLDLATARSKIPGFNQDMMLALELLQQIRPIFDALYSHCASKRIPCPSQALMASYGITSPALQRTISVSLSQMLKNSLESQNLQQQQQRLLQHRQQQLHIQQAQAQQNQTAASTPNQQPRMEWGQIRPSSFHRQTQSIGSQSVPIERPEFQVFTTDWGGKVLGWKLIPEWRHIPADLEKPQGDTSEYFTYFKRCITPVMKLESVKTQNLSFFVEAAINKSYPKTRRVEGTALYRRPVQNRSKLYRLRCVSSKLDLTQLNNSDDFSTWRSTETCWPPNFFAELNEKQNRAIDKNPTTSTPQERELSKKRKLHFRRKRNWGKDCATDITDGLEPGENTIQCMMLDSPLGDGNAYYLAVEEIEVAEYNSICQSVTETQAMSPGDAQEIITSRLKKSADAIADDEDISVVEEDTVTVSIICPMSQQLIGEPVRGKSCRHLECFDLKGYLMSRTKLCSGFSVPDSWKCPICSCEVTPATLFIDGFMQETIAKLREVQAEGDYLETKSVVIRSDGLWRPNDPPEAATKNVKKEAPEIIVLDDDDDDDL
ncbi:hypothetical protein ABW20_dc0103497 [Dactylellina cionopaga]|nr:hypothetical protein ABW20_dc0103497 [Dactylellina cionopaga]